MGFSTNKLFLGLYPPRSPVTIIKVTALVPSCLSYILPSANQASYPRPLLQRYNTGVSPPPPQQILERLDVAICTKKEFNSNIRTYN